MVILSGSSNAPLAEAIGKQLAAHHVKRTIKKFPNGEIYIRLEESVKGETVLVLQSLQTPIHEHLMELLLLVDAAKRSGASTIIGSIPWLAYSKQDKIFFQGEPLSSDVIAKVISSSPLDKLFLIELHGLKELDFFTTPTVHLTLIDEFVRLLKPRITKDSIVVIPDAGGVVRSKEFALKLGLPTIEIEKHRDRDTGEARVSGISEPVEGKDCFIFDDLISTGSTAVADASYLKQRGARSVTFCATHGLFTNGFELFEGVVDKILVSDSIPILQSVPHFVQVVSVAGTISSALLSGK